MPVTKERKSVHDILPDNVSSNDLLQDSEEDMEEVIYKYLGWRLIIWSRTLSSTAWHKYCLVDVKDIIVNNPVHIVFLHEFGGSDTTLKTLYTSVPTLSTDGSNSFYMTSKVKQMDQDFCVMMFDIKSRTLEDVSPVLSRRTLFSKTTYITLYQKQLTYP